MRFPLVISIRSAAVYLLLLLLSQLGRYHIGLGFDFIFFMLLAAPILSVMHLFLATSAVKYHQEFDTDHPIKGEHLTYTLSLANESALPSAPMRIRFRTVQPGAPLHLPDLDIVLKPGERFEKAFTIRCPFRGIYTVGLEEMEVRDVFGWIRIRRSVWHRTFYVYPRVIETSYPFSIGDSSDLSTGPNPGASQDFSLFENLTQYREGESIRHLAWKKFMALGEPYLKSYGRTSQPGITIYLDLRRTGYPTPAVLEREDCSIEITVALVKYFLYRSVPVIVHAMGNSRYYFYGDDPGSFERFHKETINIIFQSSVSPATLYAADAQSSFARSSVVFITHIIDPKIVSVVEESMDSPAGVIPRTAMILNRTNMTSGDRRFARITIDRLRERGGEVVEVEDAETIAEDLSRAAS